MEASTHKKTSWKRDLLIIGAVVLVAAAIWAALKLTAPTNRRTVTIYVRDEVYTQVSVSDYGIIVIDQGDGHVNNVVIDESGVRMEYSTCKNQVCVHAGTLDPNDEDALLLNMSIVCLPNRVVVELSEGEVDK